VWLHALDAWPPSVLTDAAHKPVADPQSLQSAKFYVHGCQNVVGRLGCLATGDQALKVRLVLPDPHFCVTDELFWLLVSQTHALTPLDRRQRIIRAAVPWGFREVG
jgi:hypothetical protein